MSYQTLQKVDEFKKELLRLSKVFRADSNLDEYAPWLEYHAGMLGSFAADVEANPRSVETQLSFAFWLTNVGRFLMDKSVNDSIPYFMRAIDFLNESYSPLEDDPRIAHELSITQEVLARALELRGESADLEQARSLKANSDRLKRKHEKHFAMIEGDFDFSNET